ncbi:MAG: sensor domain-containing protein [Algicola sp.]|nr:sensor domain-containing protein [Algicola sp.]
MNNANMEQSISDYLVALKQALAGNDPALTQDALYDAQEHFRAAAQDEPTRSFIDISEDYGSPTEIAQFYCEMESTVELALNGPAKKPAKTTSSSFFAILKDPQAYRALIYMLLSLPLGLVYFGWVMVVGLACLAACLFVVGIPVFLAFLKSMQLFSLFEGRLIETLLGQRMPRRPAISQDYQQQTSDASLMQVWTDKFRALLTNRRNWTTIGYLLLQCPLGFAYFFTLFGGALISVAVFLSPVVDPILHYINPINTIDLNWYWFPVAMPGGVLGLMLSLHLSKFIGKQQAKLARRMLVDQQ